MKFTLSWLKDHLDTNAALEQITQTLTMIGLEVEQVIDRAEALKPFTVAKILHAEKHPEADKLRVCKVQSDIGELQIVCGAPNARAGIYVALAKEGTTIPASGMVIKKTKIRGIESNGMLCSADELALGGDSTGIIELPEAKIGESIVSVLGLNDPVIEIAITPNRADCLGVRGIARDLAAAGLGTLKPLPEITGIEGTFDSPVKISIATDACKHFIGCYVNGVKNSQSPDWLKKRLEAIGQKPISALVDITNYIAIDLARPLHVYDAKKLHGNLTVRGAKAGEKLKALNGKEYALGEGMCVIADEAGAQAIGGVIGGEPTGCTEATTEVFLEVAFFDPAHVAATGRALQIESDARYRFERGVDPAFVRAGAELALFMIRELCGGECSHLVEAGKAPEWKRSILLRPERVATLGGVSVSKEKIEVIIKTLGCELRATGDGWEVTPPSWRGDIEGEADLVEEVLRINGYDNIPATPLPKPATIGKPALTLSQKRAHLAKRTLASRGMLEACTWSFLPQAQAQMFGGNNPKLQLINPIAADLDTMRPSLLPNLISVAKKNIDKSTPEWMYFFEVGLQFHDITEGQRMVATGIRIAIEENSFESKSFKRDARDANAFDTKIDALAVLEALGVPASAVTINTATPNWYHPGRSGALTLGGKIILGYFGEIHPGIIKQQFDLEDTPVAAFEIFLEAIPVPRSKIKARSPLKYSSFQPVERDFAFLVDEKVSAVDLTKAIASADKQLITGVEIFDVYTGKGIETGKKSVAVKVTLQSFERTLTDQDITAASNAIIASAAKLGATLRQ
jgi:phenylalanyl-tRNA synthetase beta chain